MSGLRYCISALAIGGLAVGYAASQYAYFSGRAADYAAVVDQPAVRYVALALLLACIVLAFIPDQGGDNP